ncbi:MAG: pitrilysin family protein [Polyangiales bacterium]
MKRAHPSALLAAITVASCASARTRAPLPAPSSIARNDVARTPPELQPELDWTAPTATRTTLANAVPLLHVPVAGSRIALRYCNARAAEDDVSVQAGLPSITAAMLAEGTRSHPGAALALAFAALGTRLTIQTTRAGTCLAAASLPEDFERVAGLMVEAVREPAFDPRDFAALQIAQMDERATDVLSPRRMPRLMAHEFIFGPAHPYGRPETGLGPEIRGRTVEQLAQFHRTYFRPALSAVIVAGGELETVRAAMDRTFGAWSVEGAPPPERSAGVMAPRRPARVHIVDTRGGEHTQLFVVWPGPPRHNQDWPTLIVLERVLGGMFSSRLNLALREDEGYSYGAFSALTLSRFGGLIMASAAVETQQAGVGLARLLDEVRALRETEATDEELAAARALERSELQESFASAPAAAQVVSEIYLYDLPLDYHSRLDRAIRAVTAREVKLAAQRYLPQSEMLAVLAGPRMWIEVPVAALHLSAIEHWSFQR